MIASPLAVAMTRTVDVPQRVAQVKQLDVIGREVRMAESDLRALIVAYEQASDDATRKLVIQKRNQTMRWLSVLMQAMVDVLDECTK
jgi:hypothetical protein